MQDALFADSEKAKMTMAPRRMELSAAYVSDLELGRRGWSGETMARYIKALRG